VRVLALAAPLALASATHADAAAGPTPTGSCNEPIDVNAKSFDADY
jgi:hypothetical protein